MCSTCKFSDDNICIYIFILKKSSTREKGRNVKNTGVKLCAVTRKTGSCDYANIRGYYFRSSRFILFFSLFLSHALVTSHNYKLLRKSYSYSIILLVLGRFACISTAARPTACSLLLFSCLILFLHFQENVIKLVPSALINCHPILLSHGLSSCLNKPRAVIYSYKCKPRCLDFKQLAWVNQPSFLLTKETRIRRNFVKYGNVQKKGRFSPNRRYLHLKFRIFSLVIVISLIARSLASFLGDFPRE